MLQKVRRIMYYIISLVLINLLTSISCYSQDQILIQAETADTLSHCIIDHTDPGYTGSDCIQFSNTLNASAVWLINIPEAHPYKVTVRFANGGPHRLINVYNNNKQILANQNFYPTGSWSAWDTLSFHADFIKGINDLKFVGLDTKTGPNIDWIAISNPAVNLEVPPVAENDTITIGSKTIGLISPLVNDYDRNGDVLRIVSWTNPSHGIMDTLQGAQTFSYKPEQDYLGLDSFKYSISDGISQSSAKVMINIDQIDWSVEMSNMIINNNSPQISWDYNEGLLLEGLIRVYKRTHDERYLNFIKAWAQYHIRDDGTIMTNPTTVHPIVNLDNIMPGFLVLHLYQETGIEKFRLASEKLRAVFDTYPRNPDGCFWHAFDLPGQLWLDGLYMGMPFLVTYGMMLNDENYAYTEAIHQFKLHIDYMMDKETGLLYHAYDVNGTQSWAIPPLNRSAIFWGRAMGWVVMGLTEILDIIPADFPQRDSIVDQYKTVLQALAKYQDPKTGLWYQVIDKWDDPRNWLETSCSMMYVYSMARAIQNGYLDQSYAKNVELGYMGVLTKLSEDKAKMVYLTDICYGTSVSSDIQYYFDRPKVTNDYHGLGSFLIMNELVVYNNIPWLTTKVNEIQNKDISIYPNPCNDYAEMHTSGFDKNVGIDIYSISGIRVKTIQVSGQSEIVRIDMSALPQGLYLIRVQSNGKVYTQKLMHK